LLGTSHRIHSFSYRLEGRHCDRGGCDPAVPGLGSILIGPVISDRIRIIKHEAVTGCGSFKVRFPDGRESQYFYWDDIPARRLRPEMLDRETAREKAKEFARAAEIVGEG
jgi:hypothetical protein